MEPELPPQIISGFVSKPSQTKDVIIISFVVIIVILLSYIYFSTSSASSKKNTAEPLLKKNTYDEPYNDTSTINKNPPAPTPPKEDAKKLLDELNAPPVEYGKEEKEPEKKN
jgi:hypothetical protein